MLNIHVKGLLANEDEKTSVQIDFFLNSKIVSYSTLSPHPNRSWTCTSSPNLAAAHKGKPSLTLLPGAGAPTPVPGLRPCTDEGGASAPPQPFSIGTPTRAKF